MSITLGIFLILHALVHLLYAGQSRRFFELRPGLTWPDGSWAFSNLFGDPAVRWLAAFLLVFAALGYVAGGVGLLFHQPWWRPIAVSAVVVSMLTYFLLWDGRLHRLAEQGGIGILLNLGVLALLLLFKWPA
jgi:hypothetical protein